MKFIETVPKSLLKEKLILLSELYQQTDEAIAAFTKTVDFSCASGCGKCCQGFIPDLLPIEAAYIASFLIYEKREFAELIQTENLTPIDTLAATPTCPLYDNDSPFHCTVYDSRPLVCRMFGFSGIRDKKMNLSFSMCRYMESSASMPSERKFPLMERDSRFPIKPPIMSYFGEKLLALDPSEANIRQLLHKAVPGAIGRILFLKSIQSSSSFDTQEAQNA